ncbi:MAG TPA: imidazole glycerol phosphate synthase subunit HisH [Candidatus Solibacter sp.]|nr:imidazole glycerol phosphate synthase subunit HisH [Candidatus Solibacter sp.]
MIAIVDYGAGNLVSVKKAIDWLGYPCAITADPKDVRRADKVVLPGVGHFASTAALRTSGLQDAIADAIDRGVPFLGICVGMQWLFEGSEEADEVPGLGAFKGRCERFPVQVKSPHVGWNILHLADGTKLFHGVAQSSFVYFTHSYHAPITAWAAACTEYGGSFCAAVERDHVFGVQFHPEKSGDAGLRILGNFCAL